MLHNEIEMQTYNDNAAALATNQKAQVAVGLLDSVNLTTLYILFLKDFLRVFLEQTAKYILFPFAALASLVQATLAWREAYLTGKKSHIVRAAVETVAALVITTAVIGSLVAATVFATITPIIFTAVLAAKTLFKAGAALYYFVKSVTAEDPVKKQTYRDIAKQDFIAALAGIVATAAVVGVFLLGKFVMAIAGIAVGAFGIGYSIYNGIQMYKASKEQTPTSETDPLLQTDQPTLTNGAQLVKDLAVSREAQAQAQAKVEVEVEVEVESSHVDYGVNKDGFVTMPRYANTPVSFYAESSPKIENDASSSSLKIGSRK